MAYPDPNRTYIPDFESLGTEMVIMNDSPETWDGAEVKMCVGDLTSACKLPIPFKDQDGKQIGNVVSVFFDGHYTCGKIKLLEGDSVHASTK